MVDPHSATTRGGDPNLLSVSNVSLSYGRRQVLDNVTFDLSLNEHAILLGPSGSGKSSLLNVICGLQRPDNGRVTLRGHSIAAPGSKSKPDTVRREHMGIVFQTLRLVSALSVRKNLLLAQRLQNRRSDKTLVDATLERLAISHRANARPHELSQGEAQRAAIARAVVVSPTLLIADEPTSALDNENTETVAQLLVDVANESSASLLIATHDDRLLAHFNRTLSLANGQLRT